VSAVDETFKMLSECVLFRHLERREIEALFTRVRIRDFAPNDNIFVVGSPADSMMIVLRGKVQSRYGDCPPAPRAGTHEMMATFGRSLQRGGPVVEKRCEAVARRRVLSPSRLFLKNVVTPQREQRACRHIFVKRRTVA
jgi:hypothetical protein